MRNDERKLGDCKILVKLGQGDLVEMGTKQRFQISAFMFDMLCRLYLFGVNDWWKLTISDGTD